MNSTIKELNTIILNIKNKTYLSYCIKETKKLLETKTFSNSNHFLDYLRNSLFVKIYNENFGIEFGNDLEFISFLYEGSIIHNKNLNQKKINQQDIIKNLNELLKDLIKNKVKDHYC